MFWEIVFTGTLEKKSPNWGNIFGLKLLNSNDSHIMSRESVFGIQREFCQQIF